VLIRTRAGERALARRSELALADAYIGGDLDVEGDFHRIMELRPALTDVRPLIRAWAQLQPLLIGRLRSNPGWIAKHYDIGNVQLLAADQDYHLYTPGIYAQDDDSLEEGSERKLQWAFDRLDLAAGQHVLDVGCGWGGWTRFCARRDVEVTGITLSRDQLAWSQRLLREEGLQADLRYQDFFSFEPGRRFEAITLMGSIEDLSSYRAVFARLKGWLAPGARVYFDFASADVRYGIASFVTKHVWPGKFRLVYLPAFTRAMAVHKFDFDLVESDRRNYSLWTRKGHDRLVERHDEVVAASDEATFRTLRILYAGCSYIFGPSSPKASAYRMVLEQRPATWLRCPLGIRARDGATRPPALHA
jgi:cyclopropane-fatty-acyl-phospholipid synthase